MHMHGISQRYHGVRGETDMGEEQARGSVVELVPEGCVALACMR